MTVKTDSVPLTRLDYMFRAIVLAGVLEFVTLASDLITHPYVVSPASNGPFIFRVISGLLVAPLTMLIAALILWRVLWGRVKTETVTHPRTRRLFGRPRMW